VANVIRQAQHHRQRLRSIFAEHVPTALAATESGESVKSPSETAALPGAPSHCAWAQRSDGFPGSSLAYQLLAQAAPAVCKPTIMAVPTTKSITAPKVHSRCDSKKR
jgi:hypothetical protein